MELTNYHVNILPSNKTVLDHGMGLSISEAETEGRNLKQYQGVKSATDFEFSKEISCPEVFHRPVSVTVFSAVKAATVFIQDTASTVRTRS